MYARLGFVTAAVNQDSDFLANQARLVGSLAYLSAMLRDELNAMRRGIVLDAHDLALRYSRIGGSW